jgi:hypothetical protein
LPYVLNVGFSWNLQSFGTLSFLINFEKKTMIAVKGIYENGVVRLEKKILTKRSIKVIVTFLEEELSADTKRLSPKDFSFQKSREKSKRYKGSLSEAVIEDRKAEL